jgi:hypothetical protein
VLSLSDVFHFSFARRPNSIQARSAPTGVAPNSVANNTVAMVGGGIPATAIRQVPPRSLGRGSFFVGVIIYFSYKKIQIILQLSLTFFISQELTKKKIHICEALTVQKITLKY